MWVLLLLLLWFLLLLPFWRFLLLVLLLLLLWIRRPRRGRRRSAGSSGGIQPPVQVLSASDSSERRLSSAPAGRGELRLQVVQVGGAARDARSGSAQAEEGRAGQVIRCGEPASQAGRVDVRVRREGELGRRSKPAVLLRPSPALCGSDRIRD